MLVTQQEVTKLPVVTLSDNLFVAGGSSCFAYMSYATQDVTINELEPAMEISAGFAMQGGLKLFGTRLGFKMSFTGATLSMALHGSPLNLFNNKIKVCRAPGH